MLQVFILGMSTENLESLLLHYCQWVIYCISDRNVGFHRMTHTQAYIQNLTYFNFACRATHNRRIAVYANGIEVNMTNQPSSINVIVCPEEDSSSSLKFAGTMGKKIQRTQHSVAPSEQSIKLIKKKHSHWWSIPPLPPAGQTFTHCPWTDNFVPDSNANFKHRHRIRSKV